MLSKKMAVVSLLVIFLALFVAVQHYLMASSNFPFWKRALHHKIESMSTNNNKQELMRVLNPLQSIDEANRKLNAKIASGGGQVDDEAFNELFDTIFKSFPLGHFSAPTAITDAIKSRLIKSERKFREGKHKKITEDDLVKAVNKLADKLALPDYAKTFGSQVRTLRVDMMSGIPSVIGKAQKENLAARKVGSRLTKELSPAEAVCISMSLIQQKLLNDLFQTNRQEWNQRLLEIRKEQHARKTEREKAHQLQATVETERRSDFRRHLSAKGRSLGILEGKSLVETFLDDLGIEPE